MSAQTLHINNKDRLVNARKNRQIQLERWEHFENESQKCSSNGSRASQKSSSKNIQFTKETILLEAVSRNDIEEVTDLLKQGVNPNSMTVDGLTGLHQCCIDDYLEMGTLLLKFNANVNAVDSEMWTPLHAAATCGNDDMCFLLIKFGADFLAINSDGNMPYDICEGIETLTIIETEMAKRNITQEQIDQARLVPEQQMMNSIKDLIKVGENLDKLDSQGATLLHIGCSLGFNQVVHTLLEGGANHSTPDREGWLPIHIAACWNYLEIVETLVAFGANIDDRNSYGDTVFNICEPQFKEKFFEIKSNVETIRNNFRVNRIPQNKSFRKSRGSSVRRSSVRQKGMLSRKEAQEEFITMNKPASMKHNEKNEIVCEVVDDEDNSDVDTMTSPLKPVTIKPKNQTTDPISRVVHPVLRKPSEEISPENERKSSESYQNSTSKPKKTSRAPQVPPVTTIIRTSEVNRPESDPKAIHRMGPTTEHVNAENIQLDNLTSVQSKTISEVSDPDSAFDHPRYVFQSVEEENAKKKSRNKECCALL